MADRVKVQGLRELDKALEGLKISTAKGALRRVAKKALEPMLETAKHHVPVDEGHLRDSIVIASSGLTRRARAQDRGRVKQGIRLYLGTASRNAVPREFGSARSAAQPYMRPAWDQHKDEAVQIVARELGPEIEKTARRAAKRRKG